MYDLFRKTFGRLTVIGPAIATKGKELWWTCLCSCGGVKNVRSSFLRTGRTKSCGCLKSEALTSRNKKVVHPNKLPPGESALNKVFASYKRSALNKGLDFSLSREVGLFLLRGSCFYCGTEPSNVMVTNRGSTATYSGIDRVDNTVGYVPDNVVSCCKRCNVAKNSQTFDQFKEMVERIHKRLFTFP